MFLLTTKCISDWLSQHSDPAAELDFEPVYPSVYQFVFSPPVCSALGTHTDTHKPRKHQINRHTDNTPFFFFSPLIHTLTHTSQACFGVRHKGHLLANQSTFYTKCRARSHTTGMILQLCFEFDLRKMFKGKFSKALGAEGASYLKIWHKLGQRLNH